MKRNIIIFGELGSGKDTVAEIIESYGYNIEKLGGEIRRVVDENIATMGIEKENSRSLYVKYGQGMRKMFGEDLWCKKLLERVEKSGVEKIIISDARQINEYKFFRARGFLPVAIVAPKEQRESRVLKRDGIDQSKNGSEETEVQVRAVYKMIESDPMGITIRNDSTLEDLRQQVSLKIISKLID